MALVAQLNVCLITYLISVGRLLCFLIGRHDLSLEMETMRTLIHTRTTHTHTHTLRHTHTHTVILASH